MEEVRKDVEGKCGKYDHEQGCKKMKERVGNVEVKMRKKNRIKLKLNSILFADETVLLTD